MAEPTLAQLDAGFKAARALADTSTVYGHLVTDDMCRQFAAVVLQAALEADPKGLTKGGS